MRNLIDIKPWPIAPVVGSRVAIKDIIGRDAWVENALQQMRNGNNLLINDPRRFGKTTAVRLLVDTCLKNKPETALKIDYEGVSSTRQFLLRTVQQIATQQSVWSKSKHVLQHLFDGATIDAGAKLGPSGVGGELKISPSQSDRDPLDILNDTLKSINNGLEEAELLILVLDELPLAVRTIARSDKENGPKNAASLLQHLRSIRQEYSQIRWVVTGSVGFHHVLHDCADTTTGVIADLMSFQTSTIAPSHSMFLADCLALGIDRTLGKSSRQDIPQITGCIPFLIQALFHTISTTAQSGTIELVEIKAAFAKYINSTDESPALDHFLTRLNQYYAIGHRQAAEKLLDALSACKHMSLDDARVLSNKYLNNNLNNSTAGNEDSTAIDVIDKLIKDHYLEKNAGRLHWRHDVLRRIWINRRGLDT